MPIRGSMRDVLRNMLQYGDLTFHDFVEVALYYPELGYYARGTSPIGKSADYVTSHALSPVFSYALSKLIGELLSRISDGVCSIVDMGCGDGSLILSLQSRVAGRGSQAGFYGVDRSLERVPSPGAARHPLPANGERDGVRGVQFFNDLGQVPRGDYQLVISNELFDALPFARLVMRGEHLHELWVTERDGALDWSEHEADPAYGDYFAERGIDLDDGQFVDVSLDWAPIYREICRFVTRGLIVTLDYGLPEKRLFSGRSRRYGTAAAYAEQRVSRDLLANPGEQDLTAHVNFSDLQRAGEGEGFRTLFFDSQAKFLLSLGATEHELLAPVEHIDSLELREAREEAKRLVLPDDIGESIRVLVQGKGIDLDGWSFQRKLW